MISSTWRSTGGLLAIFFSIQVVVANWDPASGHVYDVKPTESWLAKNRPTAIDKAIQVAECALNTQLAFPDVQLFAWLKVDHTCDGYHGCPYGDCWAFKTFPQPEELEVAFTDSHVFFWHETGGINGTGPNPISNPQTGGFGYESSLDGVYHDGKADEKTLQVSHDSNYPNFHPESLKKWTPAARAAYASLVDPGYPKQPKCGKPYEENKDPGSKTGAYGAYKPAPASAYHAPKPYRGPDGLKSHSGSNDSSITSSLAPNDHNTSIQPRPGSDATNSPNCTSCPTNPPASTEEHENHGNYVYSDFSKHNGNQGHQGQAPNFSFPSNYAEKEANPVSWQVKAPKSRVRRHGTRAAR